MASDAEITQHSKSIMKFVANTFNNRFYGFIVAALSSTTSTSMIEKSVSPEIYNHLLCFIHVEDEFVFFSQCHKVVHQLPVLSFLSISAPYDCRVIKLKIFHLI
ncbi:hypothetical protein GOODEAATRI_034360 [Goodea atripinnis]|uniref:Uncharacterized protein n=1 Tax=Goodea atripinnis TaxID=208336 RepID=A0ABV0P1W9_9TELE